MVIDTWCLPLPVLPHRKYSRVSGEITGEERERGAHSLSLIWSESTLRHHCSRDCAVGQLLQLLHLATTIDRPTEQPVAAVTNTSIGKGGCNEVVGSGGSKGHTLRLTANGSPPPLPPPLPPPSKPLAEEVVQRREGSGVEWSGVQGDNHCPLQPARYCRSIDCLSPVLSFPILSVSDTSTLSVSSLHSAGAIPFSFLLAWHFILFCKRYFLSKLNWTISQQLFKQQLSLDSIRKRFQTEQLRKTVLNDTEQFPFFKC